MARKSSIGIIFFLSLTIVFFSYIQITAEHCKQLDVNEVIYSENALDSISRCFGHRSDPAKDWYKIDPWKKEGVSKDIIEFMENQLASDGIKLPIIIFDDKAIIHNILSGHFISDEQVHELNRVDNIREKYLFLITIWILQEYLVNSHLDEERKRLLQRSMTSLFNDLYYREKVQRIIDSNQRIADLLGELN